MSHAPGENKPLNRPRSTRQWILFSVVMLAGALIHSAFYSYANAKFITVFTGNVVIPGWLNNFSGSLYSGHWYPRWMGSLLAGTGAPIFVYYSPLAYYIGSIFRLPAHADAFGINQLGLAMGMGLYARSLACFVWLKRHTSVTTAALIAGVILLEPYNFALMHIQVALAQIWALVWFPLALYCLERWSERREDIRFLLWFSLLLACIILTHIPSTILFGPVLWLYGCLYRRATWRDVARLSIACALAFGIASIYWLPACLNMYAVQTQNYEYLYSTDNPAAFFPIESFYTALPVIGFGLWACWLARRKTPAPAKGHRAVMFMFLMVTAIAGVLLCPFSKPLWDNVPLLHIVQMPFRFLSLVLALYPLFLLGISKQVRTLFWVSAALIVTLPGLLSAWDIYDKARRFSHTAEEQDIARSFLSLAYTYGGFYTIWMPGKISPDYLKTHYVPLPKVAFTSGKGSAEIRVWENERIILDIAAGEGSTLQLKQHFFPGWTAKTAGTNLPVHPSDSGLLLIDIPRGKYEVNITFSPSGAAAGNILSAMSLALWLAAYLINRMREKIPDKKTRYAV